MIDKVNCPNCGADVDVTQPDDHTEYEPAGRCPECNKVVVAIRFIKDGRPGLHPIIGS